MRDALGRFGNLSSDAVFTIDPVDADGARHPNSDASYVLGETACFPLDDAAAAEAATRARRQMTDVLTETIRRRDVEALELAGARKAAGAAAAEGREDAASVAAAAAAKEKAFAVSDLKAKLAERLLAAATAPGAARFAVTTDADEGSEDYGATKIFVTFPCDGKVVAYGMKSDGFLTAPGFFFVPEGYEPRAEDFAAF